MHLSRLRQERIKVEIMTGGETSPGSVNTTKGGGRRGRVSMTDVGHGCRGHDINPGDESYSNPSLSGCSSKTPPCGDDIPTTSLDTTGQSGLLDSIS